MSVVGLSFGSATSGTGFDVTSTVNSILSNMRAPETAWATQTTALQAQDAALSTIGTDLSAFSSALQSLTAVDGTLSQKVGATSNSDVAVVTNASISASPATHTLSVQQLATTSTQHSNAIASNAALSGTFKFQVGSGTQQSITLNSSNNTVSGLASAINALNAGVTASVVSDGNGSHLSLLSNQSGAASEISTSGTSLTDSNGNAITITESQAGTDAQYTIDGVALTSGSNTISTAINGVTFQLVGTSSSTLALQVANDTSGVSTALSNFVSSYNTLASALSAQEGKDSTGNAQPLYGDSTLSQLQTQLSSALTFVAGASGNSSNLAQLGITFGSTGQLSLDSSALSSALTNNFSGVANYFQNVGDFGQNLTSVLNNLGSTGNGALALRAAQNTTQEQALADNKTNLELRVTAYQTQLTTELNTANQILQAIPQQLDEQKQIYAAITGYGNNS